MVPKLFEPGILVNYRKHHFVLNGIRIVQVRSYFIIQKQYTLQWRIQDFPEVEAPTLGEGEGAAYNFTKISQKLHEN